MRMTPGQELERIETRLRQLDANLDSLSAEVGEIDHAAQLEYRKLLQDACDGLDFAMGVLPNRAGYKVMATPPLLALLVRVVMAKRRLHCLLDGRLTWGGQSYSSMPWMRMPRPLA